MASCRISERVGRKLFWPRPLPSGSLRILRAARRLSRSGPGGQGLTLTVIITDDALAAVGFVSIVCNEAARFSGKAKVRGRLWQS